MATITTSFNLSTIKPPSRTLDSTKPQFMRSPRAPNQLWRRFQVRPLKAGFPEGLSEKVEQSIKEARDLCAEDPIGGECVAAWDEVEELSAAASHARDRKKDSDPLEEFCKDNPETEECRIYED